MKLFVFALLVAFAAASFPTMHPRMAIDGVKAVLNNLRPPRVMAGGEPSVECMQAIGAVMGRYQHAAECAKYMDSISHLNQSSATMFCSTLQCQAPLSAMVSVMATNPACYDPTMAPFLKMMTVAMSTVCVSEMGVYCMPMFDKMGEMMPNMSAPITDDLLLHSVCHPCMGRMVDIMQQLMNAMPGNKTFDGPTPVMMRAMLGIMCRRSASGGYCLPTVQTLKTRFDAVDHLPVGTPEFIDQWEKLLPDMCGDTCLRDFLTGYVSILPAREGSSDPDFISAKRALARLMSYCVKDTSVNQFCAPLLMRKTLALQWPATCLTLEDMADESIVPSCVAECTLKFQQLINDTGCCAKSLMVNTGPVMRANIAAFSTLCDVQWPSVSECLKRVNITMRVVYFRNLKWSWVYANRAMVIASLKKDFAAALHVMPDDVEIIVEEATSQSRVPYLFATEPTSTKVTPKVSANADQQSGIEANSGSVTFPTLSSTVTTDAAVDPTQPADKTDPNGATTTIISFAMMMLAIFAALL